MMRYETRRQTLAELLTSGLKRVKTLKIVNKSWELPLFFFFFGKGGGIRSPPNTPRDE